MVYIPYMLAREGSAVMHEEVAWEQDMPEQGP